MLFFQTPYISFLYAREFRQLGISIQSVYQQELKKKKLAVYQQVTVKVQELYKPGSKSYLTKLVLKDYI